MEQPNENKTNKNETDENISSIAGNLKKNVQEIIKGKEPSRQDLMDAITAAVNLAGVPLNSPEEINKMVADAETDGGEIEKSTDMASPQSLVESADSKAKVYELAARQLSKAGFDSGRLSELAKLYKEAFPNERKHVNATKLGEIKNRLGI